jgi:hypothetical protein
VDLFGRVLATLVERRQRDDLPMLILADPFVLTTRDVNEALRRAGPRALAVPVPIPLAAATMRVWQRRLEIQAPAHLAVAAMLAIDNEYDWRPALERLGLDPAEFGRERFERFMDEG